MKVCIINCFREPDYIRAVTLRRALADIQTIELIIIKNTSKGIRRYLEVVWRTLLTRVKQRPDVYILTFRGYELLVPIRLLTIGKVMIYDEFINPLELTAIERTYYKKNGLIYKIIRAGYAFWVNRTDLMMTDTASHADLSAEISHIDRKRFVTAVVSADEELFQPKYKPVTLDPKEPLTIFYYTQLQPLHGVDIVLKAAEQLKDEAIRFHIVGGKDTLAGKVSELQARGVPITHDKWLKIDKLAEAMRASDVCLGGPFGGTVQADCVITGKTFQQLCMSKPTIIGINKESDIFTDKKDCLLVEQKNVQALVDACQWANQHRNQLAQLGANGRALYESKLSNKIVTDQLKDIFSLVEPIDNK